MPARERPVDVGAARGRALVAAFASDARSARLNAGLGQADIARSIGLSVAQFSRIERGLSPDLTVPMAARIAAVLGLELSLRAYPVGDPLRDAAQATLLERLHVRCHLSIVWRTEVPFPMPGDRRAWDVTAVCPAVRIGVEAETRIRDAQALDRRLALKERDGAMDRMILLVLDSRSNRAALGGAGQTLAGRFPVRGDEALRALAAAEDPGGNAIIAL